MQRYTEDGMPYVYKELRRIERAGDMPGELAELVKQIGTIFTNLGHDCETLSHQCERDLIERMER